MEKSLQKRAVSGAKWSLIDNLANSGITFLVGLVLARLLSAEEFGIIAIITVFTAIAETIIDGGFSTALIRKLDVTEEDYNTVFYSNIIISLLLMAVLYFGASKVADFFNQPVLEQAIPVMSITLIIGALSIIQRVDLVRKIDFKTQAKVSLIASIGSGIVGIGMVLLDFGVWSLIGQQLSRQFLIWLFLQIMNKWYPSAKISIESFKELFGFGSKILLSNLVNTIFKRIFNFVIGKFYSAEQLGQYNRAEQFNLIATNNLTLVIQKVSFPILSSIQNDHEKLVAYFRKILLYSCIITFPIVLGLGAIAKPLILFLIGEKWLEAVPYLQIMSLYGVLYPISAINLIMLNVIGRSNLFLKLEIIKKFLFIPLLFVAYYYNLIILLVFTTVYYYIEYFLNSYYSENLFNYGSRKQIKDVFPIFIVSLIVSGMAWLLTLLALSNFLILVLQLATLAIFCPLFFKLIRLREFDELLSIVKTQITLKKL